jgi:hypothetical protein
MQIKEEFEKDCAQHAGKTDFFLQQLQGLLKPPPGDDQKILEYNKKYISIFKFVFSKYKGDQEWPWEY